MPALPPSEGMSISHGDANSRPFTVLLVEDQESMRALLVAELNFAGVFNILEAANGNMALLLFKKHRPDLVLLDIGLPSKDGYWVAQQMRIAESGDWTPIIFLSGLNNELDVWRGIEAGGDDYLVKPVKPIVLAAKLRAMHRLLHMRRRLVMLSEELYKANERLSEIVERDGLTNLINRRGFDRILYSEIEAARRERTTLTLMLCDLDYFKRFNDASGHIAGDSCLKDLGHILSQVCIRPRDVAARYGGEEFALILPNTPRSGAMTFARAVSQLLKVRAISHPDSPIGPLLTLSGGITTCIPDENTSAETMIMRADEALYAAKAQGRSRFFSFEMQLDTLEQRHH